MRQYSAEKTNLVEYFVGYEKLGSQTYNKKILGVVGLKSFEDIVTKAIENGCTHILLGANKSFIPSSKLDEDWFLLMESILLKTQLSIILSMNLNDTGLFDFDRVRNYSRFHLQLYACAVDIEKYHIDTTFVFDDRAWNQNNRMIYSFPLSDVIKTENATQWDELATDSVLQKEED